MVMTIMPAVPKKDVRIIVESYLIDPPVIYTKHGAESNQ
jgi:hypothetical protein